MIDDLEQWNIKAADHSLLMSGTMSISGLRTINALISQPMLPELMEDSSGATSAAYARTKVYFDSLESYYKDLNSKEPETKTMRAYAAFFEMYAQKIDALSVLEWIPKR